MNYDHNIIQNFCHQRVRLVFGEWDARVTREVTLTTNCVGLPAILESAIEKVYEELDAERMKRESSYVQLVAVEPDGTNLIMEEEMDCRPSGADWLGTLLISAEIVGLAAEGSPV